MADTSFTSFDKDISMELEQDEELLLRCAPQKASYVLSKTVQLLPIVIIWLCFDGFAISMLIRTSMPAGMRIFLFIFFAIHLLPVWLWIANIIKALRNHKNIEYGLTNERIIIRNKDKLSSYYYKDLCKVQVRVGIVDKIFKVGDINISKLSESGEEDSNYGINRFSLALLDISNPYAVGDKLQQFIDSARKQHTPKREQGVEYETYYESGSKGVFTKNYNCGKNTSTSKNEKTEEDDYLDNIMGSINKKDEL